jgi:hypothetical protein
MPKSAPTTCRCRSARATAEPLPQSSDFHGVLPLLVDPLDQDERSISVPLIDPVLGASDQATCQLSCGDPSLKRAGRSGGGLLRVARRQSRGILLMTSILSLPRREAVQHLLEAEMITFTASNWSFALNFLLLIDRGDVGR